ncbi:YPO3983 family protein [Siccibacter turicensis]|uniref:YPO3983 family protein n=1 Tax=Siccibacter turicensis TaxID=357233 RepID=UPI002A6A61BB|nr:YPO3983 family protein [Siccibacter turicensis]MDY0970068.1 YPO3983 family protein [Siccibacter turicensis]
MPALHFPKIIFKTRRGIDDYTADDMRYGDIHEGQLRNDFQLNDISAHVDPFQLIKTDAAYRPHDLITPHNVTRTALTRTQCASLLFDEFRQLARMFSFTGPYQHVIGEMITHMQNNTGMPFYSSSLDSALREQILSDAREKCTLKRIKLVLQEVIDWDSNQCTEKIDARMVLMLADSYLPKFMRIKDSYNGLGITVHDTCATHITIDALSVSNNRYRATVTYNVQDHFGLDKYDIRSPVFRQFRLFRLWFFLQRSRLFGFRPFMTNMQATVEITGGRDENI